MASRVEPEWLTPTRRELRHELDPESGTVKAHEVDWYDAVPLREHPVAARGRDPHTHPRGRLARTRAGRSKPAAAPATEVRRHQLDLVPIVEMAASQARRLSDVTAHRRSPAVECSTVPRRSRAGSSDRSERPRHDDRVCRRWQRQRGGETAGVVRTWRRRLGSEHQRRPITFHLLAPNGRPVQTTRDLKSFWERTYPEVRKELRGRYPRHPWPEDPWNAPPTHRTKKRM